MPAELDPEYRAALQAYPVELGQRAKEAQRLEESLESPEGDFENLLQLELATQAQPRTPNHVKKILRNLAFAQDRRRIHPARLRAMWDAVYGTQPPSPRLTTDPA